MSPDRTPEIAAVVVTHDRVARLPGAVDSLVDQDLPAERFEILVVDNASTDGTRAMLRRRFGHVPNLRVIDEPRLGVSHARNAGWRSARAPLVAYLDDDAVAAPDWLRRIVGIFRDARPTPGCVGGPVEPIWETPRPPWLPDSLLPFLTVLDLGAEACEVSEPLYLYGTNTAFLRADLEAVGGYRPDLGPIGRWHRSGEDTYVQKQLRRLGRPLLYDPALRVRHHVAAERVSQRWLLRRMYWEGLARGRQRLAEATPGSTSRPALAGTALRRILRSPRKLAANLLPTGSSPVVFERKAATRRRAGQLAAYLGLGSRES